MKTFLTGAIALAILVSPAWAAPQKATDAAPADPNKPICRRIEVKSDLPSAVIRKKRVCHTAAEWDEINRVNEERNAIIKREIRNAPPPG